VAKGPYAGHRRAPAPPEDASGLGGGRGVRAWAAGNGDEVSLRGRIKGEIIEAYRAAMG